MTATWRWTPAETQSCAPASSAPGPSTTGWWTGRGWPVASTASATTSTSPADRRRQRYAGPGRSYVPPGRPTAAAADRTAGPPGSARRGDVRAARRPSATSDCSPDGRRRAGRQRLAGLMKAVIRQAEIRQAQTEPVLLPKAGAPLAIELRRLRDFVELAYAGTL